MCVSVAVSPWPGKWFAVAIMPPSCTPQPIQHGGRDVRIALARRAAGAVGRIEHQRRVRFGAAEYVHTAYLDVADQMPQLVEALAVRAGEAGVQRRDEKLTDLLVER